MLAQICQFLAVDSSNFPQNEHIIIGDRSHEGVHLIHYFLNLCQKQERPVIFVGFNQSFNHYNTIAQKLGTNLLFARDENKNLQFIEALKLFRECILPTNSNPDCEPFVHLLNGKVSPFIEVIKRSLDNFAQRKSTTSLSPVVIIDDLSFLINAGVSCKVVKTLISSIHHLVNSVGGSSICFMHIDDNENSERVWAFASHQSTIKFQVSDLKSGYCKDVHGQMEVQWRSSEDSPRQFVTKRSQFKVTDKAVYLFAAGLSTAVL